MEMSQQKVIETQEAITLRGDEVNGIQEFWTTCLSVPLVYSKYFAEFSLLNSIRNPYIIKKKVVFLY